jgi:hypothetical protein
MPTDTKSKAAVSDDAVVPKREAWLQDFDFEGFTADVKALGKDLESKQGPSDVAHLKKIVLWSNLFAATGLLTMGFMVNPITIFALSTYTFSRFTIVGHHTCHGAFEKIADKSWSRFRFAIGSLWRRFNDWFDWMMPEAWNVGTW